MNNSQKGFVVPLLIVIAVLVIGGGVYVYESKKAEAPAPVTSNSTVSPVPVPTCTLTTDKSNYSLGDTITYSWTSQNATYASWQEADSRGGYTWLPSGKLPTSGSQQLKASDIGQGGVVLHVNGPNGNGSCSATVNIRVSNWKTHVNSELGYSISYPPSYHVVYGNDILNFDENKYENGNTLGVKIQIQKISGSNGGSKADVPTIKYSEKVTNGSGGTYDIYSVIGLNGTKYFQILVWGMENDSQNVSKILSTFQFTSVTSPTTTTVKPSITVTGIPIVGQNIYPGSRVPFLNFTIQASEKDVTIDSFIIQKKGTLRTSAITKLILIDNNGTELAQGTPFSQYDSSNFTKSIIVKAGETKTFWLHAWIDPNLSAADKNQYVTLAISAINPSDWQNVRVLGNWAVTSNQMMVNLLEDKTLAPVLNNIIPSTGSIGTEFTLSGQNLNGFEGTTYVTLVNQNGQKGVIGVNSYTPQGSNTLKFVLPSSICTVSMGESGKPCPSYFVVTPGSYKIYAQPWSKQSNQLDLTIMPSNTQLITVSSPAVGNVLRVGQPYQIIWSGHFERGDEVFSINSFPTNSDTYGTIATLPIAQASCTGGGMGHWSDLSTCRYTWTPTYATPSLRLQVFNNVDGNQFGYSGVFSISQ